MKCPVCRSPQVYPYEIVDGVQVFQCRKCLLAFVAPKTPRKKTAAYVFEDYVTREKQFIKRYSGTLRLLKRHIQGRQVLEVGAGFGLLSNLLAKEGYEVTALEPAVIPHYLKGTNVHHIKKTLESFAKNPSKKYDAIILYDVIEHVDNPKATVRIFQKLLNKNGIVFIQTPNYLSTMAQRVKKWSWWMIEDHRYFFSKKSLSLLFPKKVWKECHYYTYEDWADFKKNLDGNFQNNRLAKLLFFSWWIPYYTFFKKMIWSLGKGGLITVIYQKK